MLKEYTEVPLLTATGQMRCRVYLAVLSQADPATGVNTLLHVLCVPLPLEYSYDMSFISYCGAQGAFVCMPRQLGVSNELAVLSALLPAG